jgi:transketolase
VAAAKAEKQKPTLVVTKTHIGFGSPNRQDTAKAHGEPLGKDEIKLTKEKLGWPSQEPFFVPEEALAHWRNARDRGAKAHRQWNETLAAYRKASASDASEFERRLSGKLPQGWDKAMPVFTKENGGVASRAAFGAALNATADALPELMGGSADLTPSNNTSVKAWKNFTPADRSGRYMHFGIREHGMGAIMNGMAIHGGFIPYGGTFLIFSDYMRPAIRLAAFMKQRAIYIFTHDSIGLGEDGPTHQPIEQLSALRAIPNLTVMRPADAAETAVAWKVAVEHEGGPVALVLTRQKLAFIEREGGLGSASGASRGAYVLEDASGGSAPSVVLLSSGSEVGLMLKAKAKLAESGIRARVVSVPSMELFEKQPVEYQRSVLPDGVPRVAMEAGHPMSWYRWVGAQGVVLGISRFGASAPYERIYAELGLTIEGIVAAARQQAGSAGRFPADR